VRRMTRRGESKIGVTFVLPNFNHSRFLRSVRSTACSGSAGGRVVVIDDASSDDSCAVIEQFLARFANASLYAIKTNLGVVRN